MISKSHNYRKLWRDYAGPVSRATAYAYWAQARRFEKKASERGDIQTAEALAKSVREYENILNDLDAAEGGNI